MLGFAGDVGMVEGGAVPEPSGEALLSGDDFRAWVGRQVAFAGTEVLLVLDAIEGTGIVLPSGRRPFVLVFSGDPVLPPHPGALAEGIYECGPAGEPTRTIHVSPIRSRSPDKQDYQAVFG